MGETVSLSAEKLFQIGPLPVTNTLLMTWIVMALIIGVSLLTTRNLKMVPGKLQNIVELLVDFWLDLVDDLAHSKSRVFFPIIMTFFLMILVGNFLGLLPGFGTIRYHGVPLFRSLSSDLNTTLGLALLSFVLTHAFAIRYLGIKDYLKRWVSLNPLYMFVGVLEVISEFAKIISLSFRLFGNIFAGEVILGTISTMFAFFLPLPFYFLEIIVAFVQAAVFAMLTLTFMVLLSDKHEV